MRTVKRLDKDGNMVCSGCRYQYDANKHAEQGLPLAYGRNSWICPKCDIEKFKVVIAKRENPKFVKIKIMSE